MEFNKRPVDKYFFRLMKRIQNCFLILIMLLCALPPVFAQRVMNNHNALRRVVIDAGHGGRDSGALGANSVEKDINLSISLMTGKFLQELYPEIEVLYTRTDDTFVPLHQRAAFANGHAADLFISIHCNSNPDPRLRGAETYVMGLHKSAENLEVAKTENAVILAEENYQEQYEGFDPDSDEDYIMLNMFQSANIGQSIDFSAIVQEKLAVTGGMRNRGVKQAGFVVLYLTTMPGVLIETGYLSNADDEAYLLDRENQKSIAVAIAEAIVEYKQKLERGMPVAGQTVTSIPEADTVVSSSTYRIWFATFRKPFPPDHRRFRGMKHLWHFADEDGYHYTFGKAGDSAQIAAYLSLVREQGLVRKRFLRGVKIVEEVNEQVVSIYESEN